MPTPSRYLGLAVPSTVDDFNTADIAQNWEKLDKAPGTHICTSSTRPTWGASQAGRRIYETDTDLEWKWTGTAWTRSAPVGLLKRTNGEWAIGQRTTDVSVTGTASGLVVAVADVVVPPGRRSLRLDIVYSRAYNTMGYFYGRIHQSAVSNQGTILRQWAITGAIQKGVNPDEGGGGSMYHIIKGGLAAGVYSFSFQVGNNGTIGGTSTVQSNPGSPTEIIVTEI